MTISISAFGRGFRLSNCLAIAFGAATLFALFVVVVTLRAQAEVSTYLRDPAVIFEFSPFVGLISYVGILATFSAGMICLFASAHTRDDAALLRAIGLFGLLLATDDLLMLHEEVFPNLLGFPERLVFIVYFLIAIGIAIFHRVALFRQPTAGLMLAIALLGSSVVVDILFEYSSKEVIVEDGLKFVGLAVWSAYWINRASSAVVAATRPPA
ncbi:hypothetical protein [Tabrizicola sp. BL-A-41-H6]|uniref:hypothetical protein n=1 Tax=Tabrizicola sp. BL-A-41-H6 TaxID=3421107 RepID=UPI003D675D4E